MSASLPASGTIQLPPPHSSVWGGAVVRNIWIPVLLIALVLIGRKFEFANPYIVHIAMIAAIYVILALSLQLINGISGQFSLGHAGFMAVGAYLGGYSTLTFAPRGYDPNADYPDPRLLFDNPAAVLLFFVAIGIVTVLAAFIGWAVSLIVRKTALIHRTVPIVFALSLITWIVFDARAAYDAPSIPSSCIWSRSAVALVKLYGAIIDHGAPAALWLTNHLPSATHKPLSLAIALIGGGCAAATAGAIVGIPTLRLQGDYLAIATLGFGEIIRNIIVTIPALGAATGLSTNVYSTKPSPIDHIDEPFYCFPWILCTAALTWIIIGRLVHSPKGKAIRTVRDDPIAAAATGIDPTHYRVLAFVVGAFFAGVAGALYAHLDGYLNANSFSFLKSIEIVVMVTLGGMGSLWGAAVAAVLLTALPAIFDNADHFFPASLAHEAHWMADNRWVLYAVILIVIVIAKARLGPALVRKRS